MRIKFVTAMTCISIVVAFMLVFAGAVLSTNPGQVIVTAVETPFPFLALGDSSTYLCLPIPTVFALLTKTPQPTPTKIIVTNSPSQTPTATVPTCKTIATGTVLAAELNVRSGPGATFSLVRSIKQGGVINIVELRNGWAKICSSKEEWMSVQSSTGTQFLKVVLK